MKKVSYWMLAGIGIALGILWFTSISEVPFHPDETSLLFQSRDFETLFRNPLLLSYSPDQPATQMAEYRALNPPLAKYVLAAGRRIFGVGPAEVNVDWDWQLDWSGNLSRGALPSARALFGGRLASTVLAFLAVPLLYWSGCQLGGRTHGLAAGLLYGLNGLVLLHGRRAMAEGTLLFSVALMVPLAFVAQRRPLAAGLAAGLAFSAKHSALPLLILPASGLLLGNMAKNPNRKMWKKWLLLIGGFSILVYILNPFLWQHPLGATRKSIEARGSFVGDQVRLTDSLAAGSILDTPIERVASLLGNTFFLPLQFQEVGNYQEELRPAIDDYTKNGGRRLMIGLGQGTAMLGLTLLGIWGGFRAPGFSSNFRRKRYLILILGTASLTLALLVFNPLPYQRYYVPLIPLLVLWQASGLLTLINGLKNVSSKLVSEGS